MLSNFSLPDVAFVAATTTTPHVDLITPAVLSYDTTTITLDGENLDETINITIGGAQIENCVVAGTSVQCDAPSLPTGFHQLVGASNLGVITMSNTLKIEAALHVTSISPLTGGRFGGLPLTVSGYGFDQDTIFSFVQDGSKLCSPCIVLEHRSTEELILQAPFSMVDGTAQILVTHEYVEGIYFQFDFVYQTDSIGTFSHASGQLQALTGGEPVSLTKSSLDCADMIVELTLAKDPCSKGSHNCDPQARV